MLINASKKKFINYQGHNCQTGVPRKYSRKQQENKKKKGRQLCKAQSPSGFGWGYE
jgi:hypothetical protein